MHVKGHLNNAMSPVHHLIFVFVVVVNKRDIPVLMAEVCEQALFWHMPMWIVSDPPPKEAAYEISSQIYARRAEYVLASLPLPFPFFWGGEA